jgi:hypothetical protein
MNKSIHVIYVAALGLSLNSTCFSGPRPPPKPTDVAPKIVQEPVSTMVKKGQTATFTVVASGTEPLQYHWGKNGVEIVGANNATYTTPITGVGDSGAEFNCLVVNNAGQVVSDAAILFVCDSECGPTNTPPPPGAGNLPTNIRTIKPGIPEAVFPCSHKVDMVTKNGLAVKKDLTPIQGYIHWDGAGVAAGTYFAIGEGGACGKVVKLQ